MWASAHKVTWIDQLSCASYKKILKRVPRCFLDFNKSICPGNMRSSWRMSNTKENTVSCNLSFEIRLLYRWSDTELENILKSSDEVNSLQHDEQSFCSWYCNDNINAKTVKNYIDVRVFFSEAGFNGPLVSIKLLWSINFHFGKRLIAALFGFFLLVYSFANRYNQEWKFLAFLRT